jgi:hypothetical protein
LVKDKHLFLPIKVVVALIQKLPLLAIKVVEVAAPKSLLKKSINLML